MVEPMSNEAKSPERPYLVFESKNDAEVRQNLIVGKVRKAHLLTNAELESLIAEREKQAVTDAINWIYGELARTTIGKGEPYLLHKIEHYLKKVADADYQKGRKE